jgi:hypothetical protein
MVSCAERSERERRADKHWKVLAEVALAASERCAVAPNSESVKQSNQAVAFLFRSIVSEEEVCVAVLCRVL